MSFSCYKNEYFIHINIYTLLYSFASYRLRPKTIGSMDIQSQGFLCLFKNLNVNIMWMIVYVFKFCVSICIYYMFGMQTSIHSWLKVLILPIKCSFKQLHIDICWPHPPLQRLLPLTSKLFVPNLCHVYYLIRFWRNSVWNFFGAKFS